MAAGLLAGAPAGAQAPGAPIAVVVNRSNPVENLTLPQLRDLVLGRVTTWPNGRRVVTVMTDEHDAKAALLKWCCRMPVAEYDETMLRATFTGDVAAVPKKLDTGDAVARFVFNVTGGVGFVRRAEASDNVKIVRVGGLLPEDPAYPIRTR